MTTEIFKDLDQPNSVPMVVDQQKEPTTKVSKNLTPPNPWRNSSAFMSSCFEIHSGNVSSPPLLDAVSTISAKESDSTLQNGRNGFMRLIGSGDFITPITLTPTTVPLPEPPDRAAVSVPSLKPSLSVTTTKDLAAIQSPDVNSYTTLLTALHVFGQMPKRHVDVWNSIITGCMDARPEDVGYVISHWKGLDRFYHRHGSKYCYCISSTVNAGIDMVMGAVRFKQFIEYLTFLLESGEVPITGINDVVERILRVKFVAGPFEFPLSDRSLLHIVGCKPHRDLTREAVRKSLVLLKNGKHCDNFDLFKDMHRMDIKLANYTLASKLSLYTLEFSKYGRQAHFAVFKNGTLVRTFVVNSLITMHFKCSCVFYAYYEVLEEAEPATCYHVTYNAMIDCLESIDRFIGVLSVCGHLTTTKEQAQQIEKTGKCMATVTLKVTAHHGEIVAYIMLLHTKWSQFKVHLLAHTREKYVAVLHRKMIHSGNVQTATVLIKWKALPPKHGTWECSSLRTRMS